MIPLFRGEQQVEHRRQAVGPDRLSRYEVAAMLRVHVRTVDAYCRKAGLPFTKYNPQDPGSPVTFERHKVQAWLEARSR